MELRHTKEADGTITPQTIVVGEGQVIETKPMVATIASTVAVNSAAMSELRDDVAAQEAERLRLAQEEEARRAAEEAEAKQAESAAAAKAAMKQALLAQIKAAEEENARIAAEQEAINKQKMEEEAALAAQAVAQVPTEDLAAYGVSNASTADYY